MAEATTVELDAQYRQLREECGLLDRSERGKLTVSGPEAAEYLQGQLTNDVEALAPGEGCYAALLDRKGHMQADMRVLRTAADEIWIDTEPEALEAVRRHLEMYKIGREVEIADVSGERAILSLIGPRSVEIAGTAALPEYASEPRASPASSASPSAPATARPDRRGRRRRAPARGAARRRRRRGRPRGGRGAADRGRHAALRRRDERRDDARRGGDRRGRRRASRRAATSARSRSPGSTTRAAPTATCAGSS